MTHDRQHIANIVQSINRADGPVAANCAFRAAIGKLVLAEVGIRSTITIGAAAYRAGDKVLGFCTPDFKPSLAPLPNNPDHSRVHVYLSTRTDIIDFDCASWQHQCPFIPFDVAPPLFVWAKREAVTGSPPPAIGQCWYGETIDAPAMLAGVERHIANAQRNAALMSFVRGSITPKVHA